MRVLLWIFFYYLLFIYKSMQNKNKNMNAKNASFVMNFFLFSFIYLQEYAK